MRFVTPPATIDEAVEGSPVFIIGGRRSGSSVLYRALQKHPSFEVDGPHLVEARLFPHHVAATHRLRPGHPESLWNFMLQDGERYEAFLRSIRVARALHRVTAPVATRFEGRPALAWSLANLHHVVARNYFAHAWQARGCERLVEKTPVNVPHARKLMAAFPDARLLYISRHPVTTYASYRRRGERDPQATWTSLSLPEFCAYYQRETELLQQYHRARLPLFTLSYEDFTARAESTMRGVLDFLDEPWSPQVLEPHPWAANEWDPHLGEEIATKTHDWREHVDDREAREIERVLAPAIRWRGHANLARSTP